jgi:tetratricopeptide (TPR) repeat protein
MRDYVFTLYELKEDKSQTKAYYVLEELMGDEANVEALSAQEQIDIYNKTAEAFQKLRKNSEAARLREKSLLVNKTQVDVLVALSEFYLADGDEELAKEKAKEAAALKPSLTTYDAYAWACSEGGDHETALKIYLNESVQKLINKKPKVKYRLGIVYYRLKRYGEAATTLNSTAVLNHPEVGRDAKKKLKDALKRK